MTKRKPKAEKQKAGRKPWEPTDIQRGEVRGLALANYSQEQIADYFGVDEKTLMKHCGDDVKRGRMRLVGGAATNMARMALGSKAEFDARGNQVRAEVKPQMGACCFVLKTQGKAQGWSEFPDKAPGGGGGGDGDDKTLTVVIKGGLPTEPAA